MSISDLTRLGFSLSGREPNCCFLNLGNGRFADVSYISGFNFDDDGRAIGLTDWDFDGDLDLWVVNRNGPMVRLLRNDLPQRKHFLMLRLQGTRCNRDAIGARVEVHLPGQKVPLLRTLRAGDGFLSQSTKWLHFGLGEHQRVEKVVVRWPHGQAETFAIEQVDRFYRLVQGSGQARQWSPPVQKQVTLKRSPIPRPKLATPPRVVFPYRLGLPEIPYRTAAGRLVSFDRLRGRPTLVVFWASWCQPCVKELRALKEHYAELSQQGLQVLALSVDGVLGDQKALEEALTTARRWQLPFDSAEATRKTLEQIQLFFDEVFVRRMRIAVPTSFLLDEEGRLVILYRGAVDLQRLTQDLQLLKQPRQALAQSAFPFPGRWIKEPNFVVEAHYAKALVDRQQIDEAVGYVERYRQRIKQSPFYPKLLTMIGDRLVGAGRFQQAVPWLREAIAADDSLVEAHMLLAFSFANLRDPFRAARSYRKALALEPDRVTALKNLGWILAATRDPRVRNMKEALELLQRAVQLAPEDQEAWALLVQSLLVAGKSQQVLQVLEQAAQALEKHDKPEAAARFRQMASRLKGQLQAGPPAARP